MVAPYDEERIEANDKIIRRINPVQHVVMDDNTGCRRVSTKAFSPSSGENNGMSVDIESLITQDGHDSKVFVTNPTFTGSVVFVAKEVRDLGLIIGYDPIDDNKCHGEVWGSGDRPNHFTKGQQKKLRSLSTWYVKLTDTNL